MRYIIINTKSNGINLFWNGNEFVSAEKQARRYRWFEAWAIMDKLKEDCNFDNDVTQFIEVVEQNLYPV